MITRRAGAVREALSSVEASGSARFGSGGAGMTGGGGGTGTPGVIVDGIMGATTICCEGGAGGLPTAGAALTPPTRS